MSESIYPKGTVGMRGSALAIRCRGMKSLQTCSGLMSFVR